MSCASGRADRSERSTAVHGRPALLAPIVTQLVTQLRCQMLKRNLDGLVGDLRRPGRHAGRPPSWLAAAARWVPTFDGVLCPLCAPTHRPFSVFNADGLGRG